jgi:phosphate-selective porin OprO/OprP
MSRKPLSAGRIVYKIDRNNMTSVLVCGVLCALSGRALAQAPAAETPAAPEAPPTPPAETVPTPPTAATHPAGPSAIDQRLDELDQRIRILDRKTELAKEAAAAERKEAPVIVPDERGLSVRSADGNFRVALHGLLQVDARRLFDADPALADKDTFLIRRARPIIEASWLGIADLRLMPDFGGGTAALLDAYIDIGPRPWLKLRAGKFKPPVGLERLQADQDLVFIERALDANLSAQRDIGMELRGDLPGRVVHYSIGMYNGGANNSNSDADLDHAKTYGGRILVRPFAPASLAWLGRLGVGFGFTTGNEKGSPAISNGVVSSTQLGSFRTPDQNTFFTYLTSTMDATGTVYAHKRHTRVNPQLYYYVAGFGLLAEYVHEYQEVSKGSEDGHVNNQAAHGTVSYVYGGDVAFDGVTPKHPIDLAAGYIGAVEIGFRYEWLKVDDIVFPTLADLTKSAKEAQSVGVALNWYLSRNLRASANYIQTWFEGGAKIDRATEKVVLSRLQASF